MNGVDGNAFILSRYNNSGDAARHEYRAMLRLDVFANIGEYGEKRLTMDLSRVF